MYWHEPEPGRLERLSLEEWSAKFRDMDRSVDRTEIDGFVVSTVFLGLDHSHSGGPPLIYETMVFDQRPGSQNPWSELYCQRYTYRILAEAGHQQAVLWLRAKLAEEGGDN